MAFVLHLRVSRVSVMGTPEQQCLLASMWVQPAGDALPSAPPFVGYKGTALISLVVFSDLKWLCEHDISVRRVLAPECACQLVSHTPLEGKGSRGGDVALWCGSVNLTADVASLSHWHTSALA